MPITACGTRCSLAVRFISFTHRCVGIPNVLLLSGFQTKIVYAFHISSVCASYPNHFILHALVTSITFGEVYTLQMSAMCISHCHPVTLLTGYNMTAKFVQCQASLFYPDKVSFSALLFVKSIQ